MNNVNVVKYLNVCYCQATWAAVWLLSTSVLVTHQLELCGSFGSTSACCHLPSSSLLCQGLSKTTSCNCMQRTFIPPKAGNYSDTKLMPNLSIVHCMSEFPCPQWVDRFVLTGLIDFLTFTKVLPESTEQCTECTVGTVFSTQCTVCTVCT